MEAIEKTEEMIRQERAVAWAKRLLASKHESQRESAEQVNTPEYQEIIKRLREQNARNW